MLQEHGFWKVSVDYVDGISRQVEDILKRTNQLQQQQQQQQEEEQSETQKAEAEYPENEKAP